MALVILIIFINISHKADSRHLPSSIVNFTATVKSIEYKKNLSEITAIADISIDSSAFEITLFYYGNLTLFPGDKFFIHKNIQKRAISGENENTTHYHLQGIHFLSSINDDDITIISRNKPGIREKIKSVINTSIEKNFNKDAAAMIKAFFTGNKNSVSKNVILSFRNSGTLHILSASGLHVGIAAGLPLFLLILNFRRKTILVLSLITVMIYLYITDMPISLIRSAVMFTFFTFQVFLYRKTNAVNTLMLTGILILLFAPYEIFNIGFQLSFGATFGIIVFYDLYKSSMSLFPSFLKKSMAITASAQVFTIPLILYHLHQINTISIISNIIIVPLATIFMYISFSSLILAELIPVLSAWTGYITLTFYKILTATSDLFAGFNLNFFIEENSTVILLLFMISLVQLLPVKIITVLKGSPLFLSLILCTLYLKKPGESSTHDIILSSGVSSIYLNKNFSEVTLDIKETEDSEILIRKFLNLNCKINTIIVKNGSTPNLLACRKLTYDFLIDECRFSVVPDLSSIFKNLINSLEAENIKISFE